MKVKDKATITKETTLKEALSLGEPCQRCGHCCSYGSGFFLDKDITRVAKHLKI